jgi:hypothetical protein
MPAALRTALRPPIAADQVLRAQHAAVGELHLHARVVLREAGDLAPAMDRHRQLTDPAGQDALDMVLPQSERVRMTRGKATDVQLDRSEPHRLGHLSLGEKPFGDAALVQYFDRARMQAVRARAGQRLAVAPLDDADIHASQFQLGRQHQPRRPAAGDDHVMPAYGGRIIFR